MCSGLFVQHHMAGAPLNRPRIVSLITSTRLVGVCSPWVSAISGLTGLASPLVHPGPCGLEHALGQVAAANEISGTWKDSSSTGF